MDYPTATLKPSLRLQAMDQAGLRQTTFDYFDLDFLAADRYTPCNEVSNEYQISI